MTDYKPDNAPIRKRVLDALNYRTTDRPPYSWGLGITPEMRDTLREYAATKGYSWDRLEELTEEIPTITPEYIGPTIPGDTDVWGVRRKGISYGNGEYDEVIHMPLAGAETPQDIIDYPWPKADWFDFEHLGEQVKASDPDHLRAHRLCIDCSGNPLERYTWMTGLEQTLVNLLIAPDLVHAAMRAINDHFLEMMSCSVEAVGDWIDVYYLADDLGGQTSLLMSRETYRQMIQPYHRELADQARKLLPDAKVMFHTDGAVFDILPDVIDAGIQVLEAVQTDAEGMDPAALKSTYGNELVFHGGIPVQSLLPNGTPSEVETRTIELCSIFGAGGGYIAAPTHAVQTGTPVENVMAMLRGTFGKEALAAMMEASRT